ncbi:uncharacterized protein K452DRAFT_333214 [Aplosporella prunicola CBS 121167]|uniref:Uncharacterized protein n=1 Tax=Aplosporella prunicola CBS 121167 TaxID=1176127 RepID=A0A6A6AUP8_9PEZI|nr:uncharacterized protein K452DRAFT_333214 [Aplosporella prunicola CBS 121167]KAF2135316.1 hypothetical protein K452DRAFT_333214 [Aplosporella prunicola CBS 121167]
MLCAFNVYSLRVRQSGSGKRPIFSVRYSRAAVLNLCRDVLVYRFRRASHACEKLFCWVSQRPIKYFSAGPVRCVSRVNTFMNSLLSSSRMSEDASSAIIVQALIHCSMFSPRESPVNLRILGTGVEEGGFDGMGGCRFSVVRLFKGDGSGGQILDGTCTEFKG